MKQKFKQHNAFTLAEVLITLGVIGIVAAMTMPTLIQNYKKHVVETKLSKFYTTMNQAVAKAEVIYGDKKEWANIGNGFELDENGNPDRTKSIPKAWFDKYLKPHLNIVDEDVAINGHVLATFSDGSFAAFGGGAILFYIDKKYYNEILNDDNTGYIDEARDGTEIFLFFFKPDEIGENPSSHYNKGIEPYGHAWDGDIEKLTSTTHPYGCNTNTRKVWCTKLIQLNGWKIPKDYPLKF